MLDTLANVLVQLISWPPRAMALWYGVMVLYANSIRAALISNLEILRKK